MREMQPYPQPEAMKPQLLDRQTDNDRCNDTDWPPP